MFQKENLFKILLNPLLSVVKIVLRIMQHPLLIVCLADWLRLVFATGKAHSSSE